MTGLEYALQALIEHESPRRIRGDRVQRIR
jgi:hypothetical protein